MNLEQDLRSKSVGPVVVWTGLRNQLGQAWKTAVVLFKLRVVTLLLLSAYGGAALALMAEGQGSLWRWFVLTVAGVLSAGGASGINQYLERERDTTMRRTARRPLASGQIEHPGAILWLSMGMVLGATLLSATLNAATAVWIALGAIIYVGVYTIWLKPRTTLNIVIGGAAGSCAVMSGGAAMGAWSATAVWLLAILVFVWTPVHFWALALAYREDYQKAAFPMLPAKVPALVAARWTALHTVFTAGFGLSLGLVPQIDWFYLVPIGAASIWLVKRTIDLLITPQNPQAMRLFHCSNYYLTAVLAVLLLAPIWR